MKRWLTAIIRPGGARILALALLCLYRVASADTYHLPLLPSASDPLREGVVRIVNHSASSGEVAITAIDDAGYVYGPVTLTVEGQQAVHLSATDLEQGNATKGLSGGVGAGQGDWRLELETSLDIEPSAYVQTTAGFVDRIHDLLPPTWFYHRVSLVGPDDAGQQDGQVRLINAAETEAEVVIFGLDEAGNLVPGQVALVLPAGTARTLAGSELEDGGPGLTGQLGERDGDWQLLVFADPSVQVMTLLDNVSGPLANLSSAVTDPAEMAFFPAGGDASRDGVLHITNPSGAGDIEIHAVDDDGTSYGPITLTLSGQGTTELSSADLENGNAEKGLPTGLGSGEGDWRLRLESDLDLDVVAYGRTRDGFVTAIDDVAAEGYLRHHVPWFNPASETMQQSRLRLINPTDGPAEIVIRAWDDEGEAAPGGAVSLTLAAGASRSITAAALEEGAEGLTGSLGDGEGRWRLSVQADQAIRVMSLVESSEGHLTNISTPSSLPRFLSSCIGGPADADGDGVSDHCDRDSATALRPLSGCSDGTYVDDADGNPGLAGDCRTLIGFANLQAQDNDLPDDHALRQWGQGTEAMLASWDGIVVSGDRVTEIRMAGSSEQPGDLSGYIPPELGELTELKVLDLSHNALSGPVPPSLGQLGKLTQLLLNDNDLNGAIPPELGNLENLTRLRLDGNRLTGSIPSQLGQLSNLSGLYLGQNGLRGAIPSSLGALTKLTTFSAPVNQLTGVIPAELGQLTNLAILYLFDNDLSGSIPAQLGNLTKLRDLRLQRNRFSGRIPAELGQLSDLWVLFLAGNDLTGPIPGELGQLSSLGHLYLNDNALSGPIPPQVGNLTLLENLWLRENRLSGAIPAEIGQMANLIGLLLNDNALSGPIPAQLGDLAKLKDLRLQDNRLSGHIPLSLAQLSELTVLFLSQNELTGTIPAQFGQLTNLFSLSLHQNRLTGQIPVELGQLLDLTHLYISNNDLTGPIPAELGNLTKLTELRLYGNRLSGPIPSELGRLANLAHMNLGGNLLSGTIPAQLAELTKLNYLNLSFNWLTGTVPWVFWDRVTRRELSIDVNGNLISGFERVPQSSTRPVFSTNSADNGNASHHSVAYYQGPLTWSWNWQDEAVEHQKPILGRWAALAVKIEHEVAERPLVITRVLDSDDEVLAERLTEAAPASTVSTGAAQWRTEYVFELPGSLYQAGNQLVHVIDPDGEMAETDEDDNAGDPIVLYGETAPKFKVTFIPVHFPGAEAFSADASVLMSGVRAFWPIADDFEAQVGSSLEIDPVDGPALNAALLALWNAEADPDEFYHGVFGRPRPASGDRLLLSGGSAYMPGYVGFSQIRAHDVIPHEFGHNFSLGHAPGCGEAVALDVNYPHADGGLGPHRGWDLNWRRFVSNEDGYADIMSSCSSLDFPSDYHYRKASDYWLGTRSTAGDAVAIEGGVSTLGPLSSTAPSGNSNQAVLISDAVGGLALAGRVDASGAWTLTQSQNTQKGSRPPPPDGEFTLILFDETGAELYREPLAMIPVIPGPVAGWAARTPRPARLVREAVILDAQGVEVLREELPALQ